MALVAGLACVDGRRTGQLSLPRNLVGRWRLLLVFLSNPSHPQQDGHGPFGSGLHRGPGSAVADEQGGAVLGVWKAGLHSVVAHGYSCRKKKKLLLAIPFNDRAIGAGNGFGHQSVYGALAANGHFPGGRPHIIGTFLPLLSWQNRKCPSFPKNIEGHIVSDCGYSRLPVFAFPILIRGPV